MTSGIFLNGRFLSATELLALNDGQLDALSAWERSIYLFLRAWYDASPFITAHSSGSTGKPKEIRLSKEMMRASAHATNSFFQLKEGDSILLCLSADYIAGKMMLVRALEGNLNVTAVEPDSDPLKELKGRFRFCAMVPMQVRRTLDEGRLEELETIETLIIGGSEVPVSLQEELQLLRTRCYATYGMTETASHVAVRALNGFSSHSLYRALPGITFRQDERGCLVIDAPMLVEEPLITNDVVELYDDRSFEWKGRFDFVVNSGGVKLFPESIERKIALVFSNRFFLTKEPDPLLGERLVMVVEGEMPDLAKQDELKERLRGILTPYEMPRTFYYRASLPQTENGKLLRTLV